MRLRLSILVLLFSMICHAQTDYDIKNIVLNYPDKIKNTNELATKLNNDFKDNKSKAKAIYNWIGHNLEYDVELANKKVKRKTYKYKTTEQLNTKLERDNNRIIKKTLRKNRATCDGYSRLFKKLCDLTGVPCEVITGYARTDEKEIGRFPSIPGHSWNRVYFDSEWHLLDVTWASGFADLSKEIFYPKYTDNCFDIPYEKFYLNHFAYKKNQSLSQITKKDFITLPLVYTEYYKWDDIKIHEPLTGIIDNIKDNVIQFQIETDYESVDFGFSINNKDVMSKVLMIRDGDFLNIEIPVNCKKGYLTLYYKNLAILTYKIKNTGVNIL